MYIFASNGEKAGLVGKYLKWAFVAIFMVSQCSR